MLKLKILKTRPDSGALGVSTPEHQDETKSFLAALQKELEKTKAGALALAELSSMSDMEVYKKYQYRRWDKLTELEDQYLKNRYHLVDVYPALGRVIHDCPCVGQVFERYNLHNQIKKSLYDFSQSQLSEMIETMVEVLNKKKETECRNAAG
ncbi:TPA: hypothetical protein CPT89_01165 [Candidatus Gastranaerophilales bacterium HUM_11]|nr:MAG TPA: hypothetical protein CPT89_01165 [Candidatus Gastranaerophilales bacterium HUM_11]DAX39354.1 MAG TPA: hypothetical protein [Caudoviricetes sp.]